MGDDQDRARLAAMTELDRELVLADRAEKRDEMQERRQTARLLREQQNQQAAAKVSPCWAQPVGALTSLLNLWGITHLLVSAAA